MGSGVLSDIADIEMGQSPPGSACSEVASGTPLLNGPTEFGPHHPTPAQWTTDPRKMARAGDVLFCVRGSTTGRMNWSDQDYAIGRGVAAVRHKQGPEYQHFVRSVIESKLPYLLASATGSTFPNVSRTQLRELPCEIPPLPEQKAIAHILGTLDDKIELNRRMNETLEGIARTIFKSWFIDFDPVRAKAVGRDTGLPQEIDDLFPDGFEDSVLGEIPKGWKVGRLDELLFLQRGFDLPKQNRRPGPYPVFSAGGMHGCHEDYKVMGPGIVTGRSGVLGNVFYSHTDFWPLNTVLWVKEFRIAGPIFAYHVMKSISFASFNAGSAVPTLNRNHVHGLPVVVPSKAVVDEFERCTSMLFTAIYRNEKQVNTITETRDLVIQPLFSGAIRGTEGGGT